MKVMPPVLRDPGINEMSRGFALILCLRREIFNSDRRYHLISDCTSNISQRSRIGNGAIPKAKSIPYVSVRWDRGIAAP